MTKLYKYRCFGKDYSATYKRSRNIFTESQLFMAKYSDMNDPMEAMYYGDNISRNELENIRNGKFDIRICSLAKTYTDILMWSHYADSHKGFCIELEVNKDSNDSEVEICYDKGLWTPICYYGDIIKDIMSHKLYPWQNEQEMRILRDITVGGNIESLLEINITKVYLGCALSNEEVEKYSRRINLWLKKSNHDSVPIQQLKRSDLTYWNGTEEIKVIY